MRILGDTRLLRNGRKDEVITCDMAELDTSTTLYHLRALQDGGHPGVASQTPNTEAGGRKLEEIEA